MKHKPAQLLDTQPAQARRQLGQHLA